MLLEHAFVRDQAFLPASAPSALSATSDRRFPSDRHHTQHVQVQPVEGGPVCPVHGHHSGMLESHSPWKEGMRRFLSPRSLSSGVKSGQTKTKRQRKTTKQKQEPVPTGRRGLALRRAANGDVSEEEAAATDVC